MAPGPVDAAPYAKSVEYVEIVMGTAQTSNTANLTKNQTVGNCVPFASAMMSSAANTFSTEFTDVFLTAGSPPTVTVQRNATGGTVTVGVYVVEFDSTYVKVQQGTFGFSGASTTVGITAVSSLTRAALLFYQRNSGSGYDDATVEGLFNSTSQLQFRRAGSGANNGHWYVFEALNVSGTYAFVVQPQSFSFDTPAISGQVTLSPSVTSSVTFAVGSYSAAETQDHPDKGALRMGLTGCSGSPVVCTDFKAQGHVAPNNGPTSVTAFIITFTSGIYVQRGALSYTSGGTQATASLSPALDTTKTMVWNVSGAGPGVMRADEGSGSLMPETQQRLKLANSTTVQGDRGLSGRIASSFWEAVLWQTTTTSVVLQSFEAGGVDSAVELRWETASELQNLGFHLYRARRAEGPYERVTSAVIPGLGASHLGTSYRYLDSGLANGATYFYRLEDIETTGQTEMHGPVQATPQAGEAAPAPPPGPVDPGHRYGDPTKNSLQVRPLGPGEVLLELVTEGFYAVPQADGSVRIEVPGFTGMPGPGAPWVPTKRAWVEALAGRKVRLEGLRLSEVTTFAGLRPEAGGRPEMKVGTDGTVRAVTRKQSEGEAFRRGGLYPEKAAQLVEVAFQGDVKKALVDLSPLRWDPASQQLLLAKRLSLRLVFAGVESGETGLGGSRGRRSTEKANPTRNVVARLVARERGLYGVRYDDVFSGQRRGIAASNLRLSRGGEAVAYHLEPEGRFAAGSVLYFVSEGAAANAWGTEAVYELEWASGSTMPVLSAASSGAGLGYYWKRGEWEQNKNYQSGLLEATDLWLWDSLVSPVAKSYSFTVNQLAAAGEPSRLTVWLQGASDFEANPDHHVRVSVNGVVVGEASWDGKQPRQIEAEIPVGLLQEGGNQLSVQNVGDTGAAYSFVFLDKFSVSYPGRLEMEAGVLEGSFPQSGSVDLPDVLVVDTALPARWVKGTGAGFPVEGGRNYLVIHPQAVRRPEVRWPGRSGLRRVENRAEYLLIGPREFLGVAQPLVEQRRSQGLAAEAVAVEDVYEEFGHGEASAAAVKDFIAYAYHRWQGSLRYVVLFGDGSYDFKGYTVNGKVNRVLPLMVKTTYLWTASDPSYGAVNGEDALPDVAVGRLSASSLAEAQALVAKVLAFENAGEGLGGNAVLVADDGDAAGQFETNSEAIAGMLPGRPIERIYLQDYGTGMRGAITDAFNRGSSLLSYVGHGAVAVWATENFFNNGDVGKLLPQARQPLLLTMNCLNGFFHGPILDSLSEALVKAPGKGAIAALSPSGLSGDEAAHQYEKALVRELQSARHARLGDAILAAQAAYADTGSMPELLETYQLLGDPALLIR